MNSEITEEELRELIEKCFADFGFWQNKNGTITVRNKNFVAIFNEQYMMTTDQLLEKIVSYEYEAYGMPAVSLDYIFGAWQVDWRNPAGFVNSDDRSGKTPKEACEKALDFIKSRPDLFWSKKDGEKSEIE